MKFCQFIEYDIRNIFLEQSYIKFGDDTSPKLFLKNQNWAYLWVNSQKFYSAYFCSMSNSKTDKMYRN